MKSPIPKAPLAHNFGSASIIAHTIHQKFNLKVPNYRQEEDWARMGLPITRKEISNWHIKTSQYYLEPLYNLLRERLLTQPLLHADETSYRVLESDSQLTKPTLNWILSPVKSFSFVVNVKTALKPFTGMVKDFGYYINALRTEN
ncbi:transposase [Streptococcus pneumoniae]|nr:transposase [Streptococcus pneumoniae]